MIYTTRNPIIFSHQGLIHGAPSTLESSPSTNTIDPRNLKYLRSNLSIGAVPFWRALNGAVFTPNGSEVTKTNQINDTEAVWRCIARGTDFSQERTTGTDSFLLRQASSVVKLFSKMSVFQNANSRKGLDPAKGNGMDLIKHNFLCQMVYSVQG